MHCPARAAWPDPAQPIRQRGIFTLISRGLHMSTLLQHLHPEPGYVSMLHSHSESSSCHPTQALSYGAVEHLHMIEVGTGERRRFGMLLTVSCSNLN